MKGAGMIYPRHKLLVSIGMTAIAFSFACAIRKEAQIAQPAPVPLHPEALSEEQKKDFLMHAEVIESKQSGKGVTRPYKLTLKSGTLVHDASFQSIDEYKPSMQLSTGRTEMNFRDSYKYNIAAFELAKMLGIGDMTPVTIERRWERKIGSLSWWLPKKMDEEERRAKNIQPPDAAKWDKQWQKMIVFAQLIYDTDRINGGNILISEDWHLWMIDFSRAFRLFRDLENPKSLVRCDRRLLHELRQLDEKELTKKTRNLLNDMEIKGVTARRDKIVAHFEKLIAQKGENAVLYDD
jgi:hypothetical protein